MADEGRKDVRTAPLICINIGEKSPDHTPQARKGETRQSLFSMAGRLLRVFCVVCSWKERIDNLDEKKKSTTCRSRVEHLRHGEVSLTGQRFYG